MLGQTTTFVNGWICRNGRLVNSQLRISNQTGMIIEASDDASTNIVDLQGAIIAPGFLELQTNGMRGFHFNHFDNEQQYATNIDEVATYLPSQGVTGFWVTIPTVTSQNFQKILPSLRPREVGTGASLLGAHAEGPYLHPSKKGAHNASLFYQPSTPSIEVYGSSAESSKTLKLITIAPELQNSTQLIADMTRKGIRVSLGHSAASYNDGLNAVQAGATCLTHTLNAMAPLHHRDPGLAGLVTAAPSTTHDSPYFSIIADGNHLHPSVVTMLFRANRQKCILITDSIELAGLDDGTYPGHAQIPHRQDKHGTRVMISGTDTLIGGCASLVECLQNLVMWSGCSIPEAVRCATENIADFMGDESRGKLESGRRADFVILDDQANVLQTWIAGKKVYEKR